MQNTEDRWLDGGYHHSALEVLLTDQKLPPGYQLPKEMPPIPDNIPNAGITNTYMSMFPNADKKLVIAIQMNATRLYKEGDRSHDFYCIFHRSKAHKSKSCPAYRCHYPGPGLAPTMNPPDNPDYVRKQAEKRRYGA
jgi:hypothetical protein